MKRHWHLAESSALACVLLLLLAFAMRLYRLDELPPGPYHDEAYNGLDAIALLEGRRFPLFHDTWEVYADTIHAEHPARPTHFPVYLEGNYGREPLYVYLMAVCFRLFGVSDWTLRLPSIFGGLFAISVMGPMTRVLLKGRVEDRRYLTLTAIAVATGLYPLLTFSRLGLRAIWFIVLQECAILAFWTAWQANRLFAWVLAGVLLGLSQYTYGAARLLPAILTAFVGIRVLIQGSLLRRRLKGLVSMALAMFIIVAPLARFFARYPEFLSLRTSVVAADTGGSGWRLWLSNGLRAISGLVWRGDPNPLLNLPHRPFLDPIQAGFAMVGLVIAVRNLRRPSNTLLLLWSAAMLTPSIFVGKAPHFGRSLGIVSPLIVLIIVGIDRIGHHLPSRKVVTTAIVGCLAFSVILTTYSYFGLYPRTPNLYNEFKAHLAELGRFARSFPTETTLYLTPPQKYYAGVLFELRGEPRIQDFYGPVGLLPSGISNAPSIYLLMAEDTSTAPKLERVFPQGNWVTRTSNFDAYHVPANSAPEPEVPIEATFGDSIELQGVDLSGIAPGNTLDVRFHWKAVTAPSASYTAFVHLIGPGGSLVAQQDRPPGHNTYTTDRWRAGETVLDTYTLSLPSELDPGTYRLLTGFYDSSAVRLPAVQDGQVQPDRTVLLSEMEVP